MVDYLTLHMQVADGSLPFLDVDISRDKNFLNTSESQATLIHRAEDPFDFL